ncbi:phospholipid transport system transporter-binding protein [Nitrosomonas eutropha]|uniref:Phospholipid transport system transporter-binding protein n=1 Tax=Nitrosomonas eutropha TaxID=916 RepID=A0A1I7IVC4_9PROT|nr:STAS domain-containing protein [Nitrosomonas eutropha]SFU76897.1 phospholipid transport system transporter-binding protein [Nitrosomonas eutropha]
MDTETGMRVEEGRLFVRGPVTYDNVVGITRAGVAAIKLDNGVINLAEVTQVDSSAVSMLLEWVRAAQIHGRKIEFINLPANLAGLIELYDVDALIPSGCTGKSG